MSTTQNNDRRDIALTIITGVIALAVIVFVIALAPYLLAT